MTVYEFDFSDFSPKQQYLAMHLLKTTSEDTTKHMMGIRAAQSWDDISVPSCLRVVTEMLHNDNIPLKEVRADHKTHIGSDRYVFVDEVQCHSHSLELSRAVMLPTTPDSHKTDSLYDDYNPVPPSNMSICCPDCGHVFEGL